MDFEGSRKIPFIIYDYFSKKPWHTSKNPLYNLWKIYVNYQVYMYINPPPAPPTPVVFVVVLHTLLSSYSTKEMYVIIEFPRTVCSGFVTDTFKSTHELNREERMFLYIGLLSWKRIHSESESDGGCVCVCERELFSYQKTKHAVVYQLINKKAFFFNPYLVTSGWFCFRNSYQEAFVVGLQEWWESLIVY